MIVLSLAEIAAVTAGTLTGARTRTHQPRSTSIYATEDPGELLRRLLQPGDVVIIKGSARSAWRTSPGPPARWSRPPRAGSHLTRRRWPSL
jgi:hypothetical protein